MNDLNFPVILAEFLVKSAITIALGFAILAAIKHIFPAEAKHRLWVQIFSVSLAIPILLMVFPRWEIVPNLLARPATEIPHRPMTYTPTVAPVKGLPVSLPQVTEPKFQFSWPWTLFVIWIGGVAVLCFRFIPGGVFLRRIERSAIPADGEILAKFNELNRSARRDRTTLFLSPLVKSPFTWGLARSRIVLPESAADWSGDDLEMILLHELEHVRRNDARAVLISRLFLALNWINPFAWIAIRRAAQHREEACDWRVIHAGYSSESYAAMLFSQAKTSVSPTLQSCATAVAETGTIERRIKMILNHRPQSISGKTTLLSRLSGIVTLLAVLAIGLSGFVDNELIAADAKGISKSTTPNTEAIAAIEQKLKDITIPTVESVDTPLRSALEFLQQRSVELDVDEPDPAKKGFNIILKDESAGDTRITLKLTNVPMAEALRYTTNLAQLKYKVVPGAVVILPLTSSTSEVYTTTYEVPPAFMKLGGDEATTALDILKNAGVTFPPGASAIFSSETSHLIVRNTRDQLELVEAYVDSIREPAPAMTPGIEAYLKKIESIILPSLEFTDTPLMDAAAFLQSKSVALDLQEPDPAKKGINIVVAAGDIRDAKVTLRLTNAPLSEALRYTAELAGGGLRVDESAAVIGYDESTPRSSDEDAAAEAKIAANEMKLASIILPKVEFAGTPLTVALGLLRQRSVELDVEESDPEKKGLNIVLDAGKPQGGVDPVSDGSSGFGSANEPGEPTVDLKLSNISLAAALKYTCDLAGMEYIVEPHNLLVHPKQ
ncbi:MAG: M56 family metallopeptidase [Verrucomicrobiales bacterium]|nr:M56 family metallopeptidase [Verrucomicrobiales bacterium]